MQLALSLQTTCKENFLDTLVGFEEFGKPSQVESKTGVPVVVNEFWTSRQRQAHRLHEVSYRACFKPQLPAFFINRLTLKGETVYDPFMGRGTTPLEAALWARRPVGNDINPLSQMLVAPRLAPPTLSQIEKRLDVICKPAEISAPELLAFYAPKTLQVIEGLRNHFIRNDGNLDRADAWIRMVAINRLTGHSSGFFSVYTLPPNQAVSVERQLTINAKRRQTPPERDIAAIILKKSKSLLSNGIPLTNRPILSTAPSDATQHIDDDSVDLTVTSPPFLDIVNYAQDNWLRCWFAGIDSNQVEISHHRRTEDWRQFTKRTLREVARVTRTGGHVAYEVGEVRNGAVLLEDEVLRAGEGLPLEPLCVMINQQDFTKTSNCWGVNNNAKGTNTNRIVVFRKE